MFEDDKLKELVPKCYSYGEVLRELGRSPKDGRARRILKGRIQHLNISTIHFGASRTGSIWHDSTKIKETVSQAESVGHVLQLLGLKDIGSNYQTALKHIDRLQLDTSHFEQQKRREQPLKDSGKRRSIPLDEILEGKHPQYRTVQLKSRLLDEGLKTEQCEICGQGPMWFGKPLTLQLDHIDGNRENHKLNNLRIVCPNCHTQTDTYAGKMAHRQTGKVTRL